MADVLTRQQECIRDFELMRQQLHRSIVGMDSVIDVLFWSLLSNGHGLFIGAPGLAKSLLISSLGDLLGLHFQRIQFTPDMVPGDIIGNEILHEDPQTGRRHLEFRKGPLFAQLILADEINRTPPKTQAALLQAMQERKVSYAGMTHELESPFFVFATQNPIEMEGTYSLPEAQLDRFLFSIPVDYPNEADEMAIIKRTTSEAASKLDTVLNAQSLLDYQALAREVPVDDLVLKKAVQMVRRTRPQEGMPEHLKDRIRLGAGPRASQALIMGAKSRALLAGRFVVREEDLECVAPYVLRHRLVLRSFRDQSAEAVLKEVLEISP